MSTKLHVYAGRAFAIALILAGGILLAGGTSLLMLGGSWWYAIAGLTLLVSAVLLWRGNRRGAWLYGLLLLATLIWSLWEVGLNAWGLLPRLGLLLIGGLWLLTPLGYGALRPVPAPLLGRRARTGVWAAIAVAALTSLGFVLVGLRTPMVSAEALPADAAADSDWRHYGNDSNGTRYSPLAQIRPDNVAQLEQAWSIRTGDMPLSAGNYAFEATPLKVGRLVYLCTQNGHVLALDSKNGKSIWHFDPHAGAGNSCRGVTYGEQATAGACAGRIYTVTPDNKLRALDALTGRPCMDFGQDGAVDLLQGLGEVPQGSYAVSSPPLLTHDRLVVGASVTDNQSIDMPSGVVRAYHARSGELAWAWDVGRPDRHGAPAAGETYTRSTPNVWAQLVADDVAGLVYLPTGNPSPDLYGAGRREFDDAYNSSLVAVDVYTGITRWKFQATHHDVWDYDLGSQPTLFDMPGPQGMQPAVAIGSKSGSIYVLNRLTGTPIVPVAERPVSRNHAMESLSPTQPESALAVNPGPPRLSESVMWGLTPFDQLLCRIRFRQARYEGPYTPPGLDGESIIYPGMFGGIEWGGLTVDPVRRIMLVNPVAMQFRVRMVPTGSAVKVRGTLEEMRGTGYSAAFYASLSPIQVPCMQPPWGGLFSIDLDSQRILWQRPVGTAFDSGPFGIASHLPLTIGTPQVGGVVVTRSGLIFSAATLDQYLRAYDLKTGRELWKARLPAGGQATPMTYEIDGRQYIVIAAGGHSALKTKAGDYVLAWALPSRP